MKNLYIEDAKNETREIDLWLDMLYNDMSDEFLVQQTYSICKGCIKNINKILDSLEVQINESR